MPDYMREFGVSSFKFFMNFRGDEGKYLGMPGNDDGFMYDIFRERGWPVLYPHVVHEVNLFDMAQKYAGVATTDDVVAGLGRISRSGSLL